MPLAEAGAAGEAWHRGRLDFVTVRCGSWECQERLCILAALGWGWGVGVGST